jgi:hypothetical protein
MSSFEQKSGSVVPANPNPSPTVSGPSVNANNSNYRLPADITLQHASKLSIVEDKPIMLDYWTDSLDKKALIGVRESGEKLLVKSAEEYTSPVSKFYKSGTDYIIITENSIYVVANDIPTRKIS